MCCNSLDEQTIKFLLSLFGNRALYLIPCGRAAACRTWYSIVGYSCTAYSTDRSCIVFVEAKCAGSHDKVLHQQISIAAITVSCSLELSRQQRTPSAAMSLL